MSSKEWQKYKIEDLLSKVIDNRGKNPPFSESGYPYIDTTCIVGQNRHPDYSLIRKYVSKDTYANWFRSGHPRKDDLLIATVGANIGKICLMDDTEACIAQNTVGLRVDKEIANPVYFYYLLNSNEIQSYLKSLDIGSAQPSIKVPHLLNVPLELPPLPTQRRTADILSALDEKIELNRQTSATLEAVAQAIFKEWFIDFNFPNTTGEMVESDLGMIPLGWRTGKLGEVCQLIKGVSYKSSELQSSTTSLVTLKSINRGGGLNFDGFKEYTGRYKPSQVVEEGDLVFAQTDITQNAEVVGSPAVVENPFDYEKLVASLDIVKCVPTNEMPSSEVLFYFLKHQEFKDYCLSHTNGSTVLHLRSSEVPNYPLVIPNKKTLSAFDSIVKPIRQEIICNNRQIQLLGAIRDALLPKLMNGEIEL